MKHEKATVQPPKLATPSGTPMTVVPIASMRFGADAGGLNIQIEWSAPSGKTLQLQYADSATNGVPNWQNYGSSWVSTGGAAITSSNRIAWQLLST